MKSQHILVNSIDEHAALESYSIFKVPLSEFYEVPVRYEELSQFFTFLFFTDIT